MRKKTRRILAVIGIVLLLAMYLINLVLALIGSEEARNMLKVTMVMSIMIPILLYAVLMLTGRTDSLSGTEEELSPEQKEEAWRHMLQDSREESQPVKKTLDSLPGDGCAAEPGESGEDSR